MAVGLLNVLNAVAVCASIGIGYFKWDGHSVGEVSDKYPTLITPIGWVFSIWGIIYTFLVTFVIWQLWPTNQDSAPVKAIGPWLIIASTIQALWIPAWCYENMTLATALLLSVWIALFNLNLGAVHANLYPRDPSSSVADGSDCESGRRASGLLATWRQTPSFKAILARLPFGFWFGWITVAATVNVTIFFSYVLEIEFAKSTTWASLALVAAASVGLIWSVLTVDFVFPLPGAWGALGIAAKQYNPDITQVALTISLTLVSFSVIHAVVRLIVLPLLNRAAGRTQSQHEDEQLLLEEVRKVSFTPSVSPVYTTQNL